VRQTGNVLIDITGIMDFARKIEREVGPEKVLFSSGMPFTDPGILVANVQYDEVLDEQAKRLVCGGNLRRLLEQGR
jgi:predicted TIM-barrel fold metal-dependent hydrolase